MNEGTTVGPGSTGNADEGRAKPAVRNWQDIEPVEAGALTSAPT